MPKCAAHCSWVRFTLDLAMNWLNVCMALVVEYFDYHVNGAAELCRYYRRDSNLRDFYSCAMALRIKSLRKAKGLSQQELADMTGISRSQLSEIESEAKPGNTLRLSAIAKALGVSVNELFEDGAKAAYLQEIESLMAQMSDEDRNALIRMAQALAKGV